MPPSKSLASLRPELAGSLMEFDLEMDRMGFIGLRVFPVIEVGKSSGTFGKIPIEQLLQSRETKRAPGSGYSRGNFKFEDASFATKENGAEEPVDDRESKLYSDYFIAEQVATQRARDAVLRNQEIRVAGKVFNTAVWTGAAMTTAVVVPWSNHDAAKPVDDVEAAVLKVWNNSGLWPNSLTINRHTFRHLRQCSQIIDRIQSGGAGSATKAEDITPAMLAAVFDLEEIIVAGAAKNSAKLGQAASIASVWSNLYAMVGRTARTGDIKEPCLGRTFHWGEDGSEIGGLVESYRDETIRGDVVRCRHDTDEMVFYPEAGHLLSSVQAV